MVQLTLITVGTLKEAYLVSAANEYKKRLSALAAINEYTLKEERIRDENNVAEVAAALRAEGTRIMEKIPKDAFTVALCVEGDMPDSVQLAKILENGASRSGKLCFIIGSSHGLSPEVKAAAHYRLSVSRLTFPHQLMRVMLSEILYRSFSITAGKHYHK